PWLYEASTLAGDVYLAMGNDASTAGNTSAALELFRKAEADYREAAERGRSDPATHAARCRLGAVLMQLQMYQTSTPVTQEYERTIPACDAALRADPQHIEALQNKAELSTFVARHLAGNGDPRPMLDQAIALARRSLPRGGARSYQLLSGAYTLL